MPLREQRKPILGGPLAKDARHPAQDLVFDAVGPPHDLRAPALSEGAARGILTLHTPSVDPETQRPATVARRVPGRRTGQLRQDIDRLPCRRAPVPRVRTLTA